MVGVHSNGLHMAKIKLNLGCGIEIRKGFINVDKYYTEEQLRSKEGPFINAHIEEGGKFVQADIKDLPFPDNYADYVELFNTIEHFPLYHVIDYLKEIHRVMKPGAQMIIITNSFTGLALDWLHMVTTPGNFDVTRYFSIAETIYGNQGGDSEGELHRVPFTEIFLNYCLVKAGFTDGKLYIIPEGAKTPKIGTVEPLKDGVMRNDILVAEVTK